MKNYNDLLDKAVADNALPFVVAMTGNSVGISYSGASGNAVDGRAAAEDTVFRIFSMTKAVGSVAAMMLIDSGKLHADTPVSEVVPEWSDLQVLERIDGNKPVLRAPKTAATIRHLATHSSGLEYEFWNHDVPKYMELTEHPTILSGLKQALNYPLMTDPGTRWGYGPGIDWLGRAVEVVDGRRIDEFCQQEIFEPLGMTSSAFEPDALNDRLASVSIRGEDGVFGPMEIAPPPTPEFYGMGHALYSTAPDYMRFLRMILNKGQLDGNRILTENAVATMQTDHMAGLSFETMQSSSPLTANVVLEGDSTHSFIAVTNRKDIPGKRSAGSQSWAGVLNTHYWVDPKKDIAAVIMTQTLPFVEKPFMDTYDAFERAVYASL